MADKQRYIARKYAQAILRYHHPSYQTVAQCYQVGTYFFHHAVSSLFLRLSSVKAHDKVAVMVRVIQQQFACDEHVITFIRSILKLLMRDSRLFLFMRVCFMLYEEYQHMHAIEPCTVTVSHDIDTATLQPLINWLEQQVGKQLEPSYIVDNRLIAGVRVRGESFYWEDSVARSVRRMQQSVYTQWGIS